jgi:hypothetical protein
LIPLTDYLNVLNIADIPISYAQNGKVDLQILLSKSKYKQPSEQHMHLHSHSHSATSDPMQTITAPENGSIKVENSAEGYYSYGWICAPTKIFEFKSVMDTLSPLSVERLKAILITEQGVLACNLSDGCLSVSMTGLEAAADSRLEFICPDIEIAEQTCHIIETAFDLVSK